MSNIIQYDFQGDLYSFREDGWFNATEAATRFGKRVRSWLGNVDTLEYVRALEELNSGQPSPILHSKDSCYVKTSRARQDRGGGTWLHPKLAVRFAQWLDVRFSVWCDEQIDAIVRNGIRAAGNADLIALLLRPDASEWELRFEPSYYQSLARVTNTRYLGHAGGTPGIYGRITDRWVYGCILPEDVYAELKERRNKSQKMHQWLTDGGRGALDRQIALVTSIAFTSTDMADFEARMMMVSAKGGQLGFIYAAA
ncbi:KilA-N domain-containing protein [Salinisphaera sp. T31B1]|uniref:KilA-N domain-containing protein n=1 Tax=Salinisphaera sp. T31B1 TaxID=727963 RepID=UPI0033401D1F